MKKQKSFLLFAICLLLCAGIFGKKSLNAEAADYKQILTGASTIEKSGKYYLKIQNGSYYVSKKKSSGYKKTPIAERAFSNGKQVYYIKENVLYKYVLSSKKNTKLKKFKKVNDDYYFISTIYGSQIFVTRGSFDAWKYWTYMYDTKTGKTTKVLSNCDLVARYGKYVVGEKEYRTDVSPDTCTLYKITSKGLSKIRTLTSYGKNATFVGGKLYYTAYSDIYMDKATLYRCDAKTGKSEVKLGSFRASEKYTGIYIYDITSKNCTVYKDNKAYRYTYKTKKLREISQ